MIPVHKGPEPADLATGRDAKIEAVRKLFKAGTLKSKDFKGYQFVGDALWRAQHYKCCFCEMREQRNRNDVEHWRPKTKAQRQPGSAETDGYYWLAWTWDNLFFSCRVCNQSPFKLAKFPLAVGSPVLQPENDPPGAEQPLLIHPGSENGIRHIQFRRTDGGKWTPTPRGGSLKGKHTIEVCGLDRPHMLDLYTAHVTQNVEDRAKTVLEKMDANDAAGVKQAWIAATKSLLLHNAQFVGLSYDALAELVPKARRKDWKLRLLRGKKPKQT